MVVDSEVADSVEVTVAAAVEAMEVEAVCNCIRESSIRQMPQKGNSECSFITTIIIYPDSAVIRVCV